MAAFAKISGTWQPFDPKANVSNVWQDVQTGFVRVAGVWEEFYSAVTATPATVDVQPEFVTGQGGGLVVSDIATGTVSDGVGPFTYAWSYVSGDAGISPTNPTGASSAFAGNVPPTGSLSSTQRLTVTDTGNGNATFSDTVKVTLFDDI